ncbi:hypothetical protein Spith_2195 [Spirochaeta thermophila DSM 6578]|uniref:Uncharacterized protein n=1 Tax=Winmispira thermophila (strain ATCC 700085 / DSM 6578 / Z-1203) TaxID=869211 RepID=G0GFQ1_WINT7|nr:hypothetical protein [Spirochaeta thermophila]AEJ62450.1 hypothetical protein Spith_2195 [Spirochaeta thermophila DSM 6578]
MPHRRRWDEDDHPERHDRYHEEGIISGLSMILVFGVLWSTTNIVFFVFPLVFAGIIPLLHGLRKLFTQLARRTRRRPSGDREKEILLVARRHGGVLTPTILAVETELTLKEAEKMLEQLASKGYASMEITDSGRIEYHFPEFKERGTLPS